MTRMTGPDCAVMCNLINTHTHTHYKDEIQSLYSHYLHANLSIGNNIVYISVNLLRLINFVLLFLTFSALVANPKKTTLHGGQSRSWSAEQGKKEKEKVWQRTPPPPPARCSFGEKNKNNKIKNNKITGRIHMARRYASRRYAGGLGPSRIRTRIPTTRQLGQWVSLRKTLRVRVRLQLSQ